jgi:acyl carrier protein
MEIKTFIEHFVEQFDETPAEVINENTSFREVDGWDSLIALGVIAMIDDEYGTSLSFSEMKECTTLLELFEAVKRKKA